jgi:NTP pyrophosphatase (non-canonical NTP hydrolase)
MADVLRPIVFKQYIDGSLEAARAKLEYRLRKKGYGAYASKHEILGILTEEYKELIDAVQSQPVVGGKNSVREELLDIAVGCLFGIASIDCGAIACEKTQVPDPDAVFRQDTNVAVLA